MLTELDTSQIIRSYIGVELAGMDGSVSTSDDLASGLASNRDFNSELDVSSSDDDDDDDISLHIRDEACQTGDDDTENPAAESRLPGYFPILRRRPTKLDCGDIPLSAAEEISVWRTLLHSDDSYNDFDNDVVKYTIPVHTPRSKQSDVVDRSFPAISDDNAVMSAMMANDDLTETTGEVSSQQGGAVVLESSRRPIRSHSDSSLHSSEASSASRKSRTSSVPCIVAPLKPQWSDLVSKSKCSSEVGGPTPEAETAVIGTSTSEESHTTASEQEVSMLIERHLDGFYTAGVGEDKAGVGTSLSDVTVAIQSELPGDTVSMATSNLKSGVDSRLPIPVAEETKSQEERDNVHATVHPTRVTCMDHQVCGLLADFVAHL